MSAVLQVESLSLIAEGTTLVEDVSFAVKPGQVLGIVGESGSGKSLTVMTAAGLTPPGIEIANGTVSLGERRIAGSGQLASRAAFARDIGVIFQDPFGALNPVKRVGNILIKVLTQHYGLSKHEARQRSIDALSAVGIPSPEMKIGAYPHELSGGQQQRVVIALALLGKPKLIIADEPTTALDPSVQKQILDLIREMKAAAATVFVTHDFGAAAYLCDEIAVMYAGRIVEAGPIDNILLRPKHPYTKALIACAPSLDERPLISVPGQPISAKDRPTGCAFGPRCPQRTKSCDIQPPIQVIAQNHKAACHHITADRTAP